MHFVAKGRSRRVFSQLTVIFNNEFCWSIPPVVLRIRIEERNGLVGLQRETMLDKRCGGCNCAQDRGFAGCVWPINPDDERQALSGKSSRIPKAGQVWCIRWHPKI